MSFCIGIVGKIKMNLNFINRTNKNNKEKRNVTENYINIKNKDLL